MTWELCALFKASAAGPALIQYGSFHVKMNFQGLVQFWA